MSAQRRPDIVVGIDVGQTCSGVAYSIGPDWSEPRTLNRWPSNVGIEKADKVATRVGYTKDTNKQKNWGFESVFADEGVNVREQFKLTLDADYEDDRGFTCHDARQWYLDYLRCLHGEIEKFFDASIPRWRNMHVEYSFSTPTTWKNPAMIASIEELVKSAGFASTSQQSVRMALTEAEAAAIEASTTQYRTNEIFLICDAGGGTTDVNLLKVKSTSNKIELEPLDHVEGVPIGSTLIDFRMAEHIMKRLHLIQDHLDGDIYCLADEMLTGRFQIVKHSFPNPVVDQFWLDVKGLAGSHTFPEAGIKDSRISISRTTLTEIFDQQIGQIFSLIDERLLALQADSPAEQVSYIILSGGLGSSPYLYDQIKKRYQENVGFRSANTSQIQIMKVLEPQLAVVRGLVRERTQRLGTPVAAGPEVFETRRCRNSYGAIVRELYNDSKHRGLPIVQDMHDGRQWVDHVVDWFIKRGQVIKVSEGVRQPYGATISGDQVEQPRRAQIVMSSLPVERLPVLSTDSGCKHVVTVDYKLTNNDMKLKNRQMWRLKKKYWRAEFFFVTIIGPADFRFQIEGKNGVLSSSHESLKVEFVDSSDEPLSATVSPRAWSAQDPFNSPGQTNGRAVRYA
ncbi:hypothetical protein LTR85_000855 [Meristemomyces frigidus]|nr:hypothetical protein LTR85_000855 [Meristemomyces frigidus]